MKLDGKNVKICSRCDEPKPTSEFSVRARSSDGLASACRPCLAMAKRAHRVANPEYYKTLEAKRKKCPKRLAWQRADYAKNRERHIKHATASRLHKQYGLTIEEYDAMYSSQNGKCAICQRPQEALSRKLSVDHNHKTGAVRALLCHNCNCLLGHSFEKIEILKLASEYLEAHQ